MKKPEISGFLSNSAFYLLLLALFLRLFRLDFQSLWSDEGYSRSISLLPLSEILRKLWIEDAHPPLYYFLLHWWSRWGDSAFHLRLPSALFGGLAVMMFSLLWRRLYGKRCSGLGAAIFAFSALNVYMVQEIRMYSLAFFLAMSSCYFSILWNEEKKTWQAGLYAVTTALLVYTHYVGIVLVMIQNLYFFRWGAAEAHRAWLRLQALLLLLLLPLLPLLAHQVLSGRGPDTTEFFWHTPLDTFILFLCGYTFYPYPLASPGYWILAALALVPLLVLLPAGKKRIPYLPYWGLMCLVPVLLFLAVQILLRKPLYSAKYLALFSPFYYGLAAIGMEALWERGKRLPAPAAPGPCGHRGHSVSDGAHRAERPPYAAGIRQADSQDSRVGKAQKEVFLYMVLQERGQHAGQRHSPLQVP